MSTRAERVSEAQRLRAEGLLLREIAERMGSKVSTVHAWLTDPDLSRGRARRATYAGTCDTCGGPTDGSNGPDRAPTRCLDCLTWTHEAILEALRDWGEGHGGIPPREIDARIGGAGHGCLPYERTVAKHFGGWNAGLLAAGYEALHRDCRPETAEAILAAVRAGERVVDIADRFGVTPRAISARLGYLGTSISRERAAA